ncbi:MAG TPA: efflux RND transporter periplasmic adaptor subunit [Deltaproteobacteria bacterium]|nr:efflux RND transporter periplasmic adaptor subunit [Deltaproteobacteria bacterium]
MKKPAIITVVVIFVLVFAWQIRENLTRSPEPSVSRQSPPVAVVVTPVEKMTIRDVGTYSGTLLPDSEFIVAPKIAGRVEKIFVEIGDILEQGQLVAILDDDEYVQQVIQARAEMDIAKASIDEARSSLNLQQRELDRAKTLREKKILSEAELDTAEAQYMAALSRYNVTIAQAAYREAELRKAEVRLEYTRIRASWNGENSTRVVGERYVDEGAMLSANAPIASILNISTLKAIIFVIERDYPRINSGQRAIISTDAYPGKTFPGTIARVAPVLQEAARQARVEIAVSNPELLLKPGMFVRAQIEFDRRDDATVVPINALIKSNGQSIIFLADRETMRVRRIPVEIGIIDGTMAEVLSPPLAGTIVTIGQHLLEDGASILLPEGKVDPVSPETRQGSTPLTGTQP